MSGLNTSKYEEKKWVKKHTAFSVNLNDYYRDVKTEFQRHLEREISKESKSIAPLISKGIGEGKQLRPILCRLVSDSLGGDARLLLLNVAWRLN